MAPFLLEGDEYPKHSSYTRVLSCFQFISFSNKCVYSLVSDTRIPVHFRENNDIWRLSGGGEKKNGKPSSNVVTFQRHNILK